MHMMDDFVLKSIIVTINHYKLSKSLQETPYVNLIANGTSIKNAKDYVVNTSITFHLLPNVVLKSHSMVWGREYPTKAGMD